MVRSTSSSKRYQMGAGEIHPINFNRYLFASVLKGNVLLLNSLGRDLREENGGFHRTGLSRSLTTLTIKNTNRFSKSL